MRTSDNCLASATISSAFWISVAMASVTGTTNSSSSITVITTTAGSLRCHRRACRRSISGQVATTIVVAQMPAPMNGRKTQNAARIKPAMNSTPSVVRARSWRGSGMRRGSVGAAG